MLRAILAAGEYFTCRSSSKDTSAVIIAFKLGDVVKLKSGGPKMTVIAIIGDHVRASWFAGSKYEVAHVPIDAIVHFPTEEASAAAK